MPNAAQARRAAETCYGINRERLDRHEAVFRAMCDRVVRAAESAAPSPRNLGQSFRDAMDTE